MHIGRGTGTSRSEIRETYKKRKYRKTPETPVVLNKEIKDVYEGRKHRNTPDTQEG